MHNSTICSPRGVSVKEVSGMHTQLKCAMVISVAAEQFN